MRTGAVLVAGGRGVRLGGAESKALSLLGGEPLVVHALRCLFRVSAIDEIVIVAPPGAIDRFRALPVEAARVPVVVGGGERRQDSVRAGLRGLRDDVDWVVVHDAARPLVSANLVERTLAAAMRTEAAIAAIPVRDTLKAVDPAGTIVATRPRDGLWLAQTPQAFRRELLDRAHRQAESDGFEASDDAVLVERLGHPVAVVPGDPRNLKITFPEDLTLAEALLLADD